MIKRYHFNLPFDVEDGEYINKAVDRFIKDIHAVCENHGFSLSHEDWQGRFVIEPISNLNNKFLSTAFVENISPN